MSQGHPKEPKNMLAVWNMWGGGGGDEVDEKILTFNFETHIFLHIFETVMPHFVIEYIQDDT